MDEQQFIGLAARFVSGVASSDEIDLLNALITEPRYADLFRIVHETWLVAGKSPSPAEFDAERGYERFAEKIRKHEPVQRWGPNRRRFPQTKTASRVYYALAGAFVLSVILLFGINIYETEVSTRQSFAWNEKSTRPGEKILLSLPDGSTITLNADSKVKYPAQFNSPERNVYLEGEAFFTIAHDPAHPFIVHTANVSTTDLGTKFNISAFPSDSTITVSLEEGKVDVAFRRSNAQTSGIVLSPSQQFSFNRISGTSVVGSFDARISSGWKDNLFVFDNVSLARVLKVMERQFGVRLVLADTAYARRIIKAEFRNESVWTVAEILKKAAGLSYTAVKERDALKKIIFTRSSR
jgi:transmembrane sensor